MRIHRKLLFHYFSLLNHDVSITVSTNKTSNLIFPFAIESVDIGIAYPLK